MTDSRKSQEEALAGQIPEFVPETPHTPSEAVTPPARGMVGSKLGYKARETERKKDAASLADEKHLTKVGQRIGQNADIRDGWMEVERELLGDRDIFYPEDWVFRVRPATVEVVRNWSTVDENNPNSVDEVFNEILRYSLSIKRGNGGSVAYTNLNHWDRFFFINLIREYTFINGEHKVEFTKECPFCGADVTFHLESTALQYDTPDPDVLKYYDRESQTWNVDPAEFDVASDSELFTLYLPTIEKDAAIKTWLIGKYQEDENSKLDAAFIKFLPWICPKLSRDADTAKKQIRAAQVKFRSFSVDEFNLINDIITNADVTPLQKLTAVCPDCEEEVSATITFPDGLGSLFNVVDKSKKFGTK